MATHEGGGAQNCGPTIGLIDCVGFADSHSTSPVTA